MEGWKRDSRRDVVMVDIDALVPGEHERQFSYEAHTVCEWHGFVLDVEVTAGNIHDSVAWDTVYDRVAEKYDTAFVTMDAGYKTPMDREEDVGGRENPHSPLHRIQRQQGSIQALGI